MDFAETVYSFHRTSAHIVNVETRRLTEHKYPAELVATMLEALLGTLTSIRPR